MFGRSKGTATAINSWNNDIYCPCKLTVVLTPMPVPGKKWNFQLGYLNLSSPKVWSSSSDIKTKTTKLCFKMVMLSRLSVQVRLYHEESLQVLIRAIYITVLWYSIDTINYVQLVAQINGCKFSAVCVKIRTFKLHVSSAVDRSNHR